MSGIHVENESSEESINDLVVSSVIGCCDSGCDVLDNCDVCCDVLDDGNADCDDVCCDVLDDCKAGCDDDDCCDVLDDGKVGCDGCCVEGLGISILGKSPDFEVSSIDREDLGNLMDLLVEVGRRILIGRSKRMDFLDGLLLVGVIGSDIN